MKINLETTLKKEQKYISKLSRKFGWKFFLIFSIIFIIGAEILIYFNNLEMIFIGLSMIAVSIITLVFGLPNIKKNINECLQTNSVQAYLKEKIKEYLEHRNCYHENVLTFLVSKYNKKSTLQLNSAIIISLMIFVFSPFWSVLLDISYKNTQNILNPFLLLLVMLGLIFCIYILIYSVVSYYLYNNVYIRNILEELLLDYYFEKNNGS
ncbi:hypothetical protein HCJ02_01825 [Listeria seeligeri]|uniref:hypothetical protein n=1 Tax=Listeria TaxID=1637 RepID=UPI0016285B33|nr:MULTISPECIES: hypothetical protein [Listeria]MBC1532072.1 hypothetical protein [Listeria seeligeri]MBC1827115.1 hypothetical protein [Listeria seeligeri]MBC1840093.1 hypothetical protein [Listeria seeligeri]MBC6141903.1 hypothetical protein [Listeria seeligeri]MBC6302474.1 hypothetical protein [Listeria immobilis]